MVHAAERKRFDYTRLNHLDWNLPDISQIKIMAQFLLQSAQVFSPRKTSVVSLCCFCFIVSQPRADKIKAFNKCKPHFLPQTC